MLKVAFVSSVVIDTLAEYAAVLLQYHMGYKCCILCDDVLRV